MSVIWKIIIIVLVAAAAFCTTWCIRDAYLRSKCEKGKSPVKGDSF